jgi:hypothetical protein
MKTYKKLLILSLGIAFVLLSPTGAQAMTPTLSLYSNYGGNSVNISVSGDPNSNVILYYNLYGNIQARFVGSTNYYGYFSSTINGSEYGNIYGSVYVVVNGQQSAQVTWPFNSYGQYWGGGTLGLAITSLTLPVGSSTSITATNLQGLYVSSITNSSVASISYSSQIPGCTSTSAYSILTGQACYQYSESNRAVVITALSPGISTVTFCQVNACTTVNILVTKTYQ